ncbi:unnamed protein product [Orchesella dallaii]|uniref:Uncharacterized protein n=1 Tax=Orchesella dallaii TaxID=48710 RepID=A0ABP1S1D3_9HEXA
MGVFGAAGHAITALAFLQLELQRVELMDLFNRVLSNLEKEIPNSPKAKNYSLEKVECYQKHKKVLTRHMLIGLFVMVTNIPIHAMIPAASPCAASYYLILF